MVEDKYWYRKGEKKLGPFVQSDLIKLEEEKEINDKTLISIDDGTSWREYSQVEVSSKETFEAISSDSQGWMNDMPTPWRRYAARVFIDLPLNGLIGMMAISFIGYSIAPMSFDAYVSNINIAVDIILTAFVGCLISGAMIGTTGSTIGKLIFGLKVKTLSGENPGLLKGITRDLQVYFSGMWLAIPLLSLFGIYLSYKKLAEKRTTLWDEGEYVVLYRPSGGIQYILNVIGIVFGISIITLLRTIQ